MIKAIFFDMGGVLLPLNLERCLKAYREVAGFKDIERYIDPCHQNGFFLDLEGGRISVDDFMAECLSHCAPGTTRETVLRCHNRFFGIPDPDDIALLKELGQQYDIFLLSNNNAMSMSLEYPIFKKAGLPLDKAFKKMFLSHEMRLLKPDPLIYSQAIEQSGHPASECLFIDDSQKNVDGGNAAGMHAVLYRPGTDRLRTTVTAALKELNS